MSRLVPSRRALAFLACWLIAAGLLAWAMWSFGHRQFGGFDYSALVDTAWRMASHQRPYVDFYLTTPIAFYLGAGFAFAVWGPSWSALVWVAIAFALLTFALLTISLSSFAGPKFSIGLPLVCELLAMGVASIWWYNSITAIAACVFVAAAIALVHKPSSRVSVAVFTLATFLLLMMKPNTAGLLVVAVTAILMGLRGIRRLALFALALSSALLVAMLAALRINPLDVVSSYLEIAKTRGMPSAVYLWQDKPGEIYLTIPLLVLCIVPVAVTFRPTLRRLREGRSRDVEIILLSLAGMLVAVLGMFTDSDSSLVIAIPLLLLSAASLLLWMLSEGLTQDHSSSWIVALAASAVAASVIGASLLGLGPSSDSQQAAWSLSLLFSGAFLAITMLGGRKSSVLLLGILAFVAGIALLVGNSRLRVKYIGPNRFYQDKPLVPIPEMLFFDGSPGSPRLREVVSEMGEAVNRFTRGPGEQPIRIFFGPRLEFAYAAFDIQSPRHLPIWYHPGTSYPEAKADIIAATFLSQDFDLGIFLRTTEGPDFTYMPTAITQDFETHYLRTEYSEIVVFVRETSQTHAGTVAAVEAKPR